MAWSSEDTEQVTSGNSGQTVSLDENQRAHVQVVRQGTKPFAGPCDVLPKTSTNPSRGSKAWDDNPYKPFRILANAYAGSVFMEGPANFHIDIVDPLAGTFNVDIYYLITGS